MVGNLEIIGEASKRVSPGLKVEHQNTQWQLLAGMRGRLIHDCFGENIGIVVEIAINDAPVSRREMAKI